MGNGRWPILLLFVVSVGVIDDWVLPESGAAAPSPKAVSPAVRLGAPGCDVVVAVPVIEDGQPMPAPGRFEALERTMSASGANPAGGGPHGQRGPGGHPACGQIRPGHLAARPGPAEWLLPGSTVTTVALIP